MKVREFPRRGFGRGVFAGINARMPYTPLAETFERITRPKALKGLGAVFMGAFVGALAPGEAWSQGHRAVVIADPSNAESLYVANYYASARALPWTNVLYFAPEASDYRTLHDVRHPALLGELAGRGIGPTVDFVLLTPDAPFKIDASGLVIDACSPVTSFALASAYGLAPFGDLIAASPQESVGLANGYNADGPAVAFSSQIPYLNGSASDNGRRSYIAAHIGYRGFRGNTLDEVLATIDRGVASDGTLPLEPIEMIETSDTNRSGPRDDLYAEVASSINALGYNANATTGTVPTGGAIVSGVMTGLASPEIDEGDFSFVPGAYADHLTSFAAAFDLGAQRKMSRWIAKGATLTSGAVEEPCNYPGKFPTARLFENAVRGLTLGEAYYRAAGFVPFQIMLMGDPLARPWGATHSVQLFNVPTGVVGGSFSFVPFATPGALGDAISELEVFVDGVRVGVLAPGQLPVIDTSALPDGWHELRVVAYSGFNRVSGEATAGFLTNNAGGAVAASVSPSSGALTDVFTFDVTTASARSDVREVRLVHNGRVVGSAAGVPASIWLHGHLVGAGSPFVFAEIEYSDGAVARSAPFELEIAFDDSAGSDGFAPRAFTYRVRPPESAETFVVPLAADHSDDPGDVVYRVVQAPTSATILEDPLLPDTGPFRVVRRPTGDTPVDLIVFEVEDSQGRVSTGAVTIVLSDSCPADQNLDGGLTGADYNAFLTNFLAGDPMADLNGDGNLSGADFNSFLTAFGVGCDAG